MPLSAGGGAAAPSSQSPFSPFRRQADPVTPVPGLDWGRADLWNPCPHPGLRSPPHHHQGWAWSHEVVPHPSLRSLHRGPGSHHPRLRVFHLGFPPPPDTISGHASPSSRLHLPCPHAVPGAAQGQLRPSGPSPGSLVLPAPRPHPQAHCFSEQGDSRLSGPSPGSSPCTRSSQGRGRTDFSAPTSLSSSAFSEHLAYLSLQSPTPCSPASAQTRPSPATFAPQASDVCHP